ncbi:glycoside hydrolase family 31 protein [Athelia psychrophila]|uniref:Glycoside hydrolase family 31 protein n=1 Tax=Athelia psychrophila TaxID=1759441 RepID=A0A166LUR4_9AGAM|nr:glycoside hydrolase family 31 protein [Fibularhizoctonia sp. CBS 109695]
MGVDAQTVATTQAAVLVMGDWPEGVQLQHQWDQRDLQQERSDDVQRVAELDGHQEKLRLGEQRLNTSNSTLNTTGMDGGDPNDPPHAIHNGASLSASFRAPLTNRTQISPTTASPPGLTRNLHTTRGSQISPTTAFPPGLMRNLHTTRGYREEATTYASMLKIRPNERPFLISRSTFLGAGRVMGHWTGDNYSKWLYLRQIVQGALQFALWSIPMTGSDTCGFNGNSGEELCNRWMQAAVFLPFFRNYNTIGTIGQEPYRWDSVADAAERSFDTYQH